MRKQLSKEMDKVTTQIMDEHFATVEEMKKEQEETVTLDDLIKDAEDKAKVFNNLVNEHKAWRKGVVSGALMSAGGAILGLKVLKVLRDKYPL